MDNQEDDDRCIGKGSDPGNGQDGGQVSEG